MDAHRVASDLQDICLEHLRHLGRSADQLSRILVYDCPPLTGKTYHPLLKRAVEWGETDVFKWRTAFHNELKLKRKVALRLGKLKVHDEWIVKADDLKRIANGKSLDVLADLPIKQHIVQKEVDLKIGIDMTTLALKKIVDQMVLISGDRDFVPAIKVARREGIEVILNPLMTTPAADLLEHVDGFESILPPKEQRN